MDHKSGKLKLVWSFSKKYLHMFAIAEICMLVSYTVFVLLPLNLSRLADEILTNERAELLPDIIRDYIVMFVISMVFNFIYAFVWQYLNNHYIVDVKNKLYENVLTAKASFLSTMNSGDIMTRIDKDSEQFIHVIQRNIFHFVNSIFLCVGIIGYIATINVTISVMLAIAAVLPIIFTKILAKFTEKYSVKTREIYGKMIGKLYEMLKGLREIRLSKAGVWAEGQLVDPLDELNVLGNKTRNIDFIVNRCIYLINLSTSLIIYGFSVHLVANSMLSIGMFLAIIEYVALLHKKINWMYRIYLDWHGRKISIDRVNETLLQQTEQLEGDDVGFISSVQFKDVCFEYKKDVSVLKQVNFNINCGEKVALVGGSGNGKTTIISLLLGLYDTSSGDIYINGISIKEISKCALRKKVGVVSQDIILFEDSVKNNVSMGNNYSDEEICDALSAVNLLEIIEGLPDGINTVISESSCNLSGGQKQRLMIARLLLKKPEFIILDEATSALDIVNERYVTEYINKTFKEATMFIISHRLETIRNCDKILVLNNNHIENVGTHKELLKTSDTYRALFGGD